MFIFPLSSFDLWISPGKAYNRGMSIGITALGTYLPEKRVTNEDLSQSLETTDEWIRSRTGITQRFIAAEDEYCSDLAIAAVEDLIRRHGPQAIEGVDLIIVATATPDAFFPSTAALVQRKFQLNAAAFDISTACAGWVYGLTTAYGQIKSGISKKVLVIGAETLSKIVDWNDRTTAVLFGDGAGAAIVEAVDEEFGFRGFAWNTDGNGGDHLFVGAVDQRKSCFIVQNGREVFKFATRSVPEAILKVLEKSGDTLEQIDLFAIHQANYRIIDSVRERLGVSEDKFVVSVGEYANNSAATVPLALDFAMKHNQLKRGDKVCLVGFGGGFAWASAVFVWSI